MKLKHAVPGLVMAAVGGGIYAYSTAKGLPLVIRGTSINWGLGVLVTGLVLAVINLVQKRREL